MVAPSLVKQTTQMKEYMCYCLGRTTLPSTLKQP